MGCWEPITKCAPRSVHHEICPQVPFRCLPMPPGEGGKAAQEADIDNVIKELNIDTVILAR